MRNIRVLGAIVLALVIDLVYQAGGVTRLVRTTGPEFGIALMLVVSFVTIVATSRKTMGFGSFAPQAARHGGRERTRDNVLADGKNRARSARPATVETPGHTARFTSIGGGRVWRTRSQYRYLATSR